MSLSDQLCNASATGDLLQIITLLQSGADVNGRNAFSRTAIQVVKLGDTRVIETLLHARADPNVPDPSCGLTVIHDAAREGFVDSVRALLEYDADANISDQKGNLPLHLAARNGHLEVVRLLIGYTENRGVRNNDGFTAEQLARDNRHTDTATFIQNYQ